MLSACLVFGYCISSYSYRWQDLDKYQTPIFILAICSACAVGTILDNDANLIMLGYIPWALCLAILVSAAFHWMIRRLEPRRGASLSGIAEKGLP
jgi:hypothetical protein